MIKNALTLLLLGSCMASSSFAFNLSQPLHKIQKNMKHQVLTKQPQSKNTAYTDFSGNWTGTCIYNAVEVDDNANMTIFNDNDYMEIDGNTYYLNGDLKTEANANTAYALFDHLRLNWNADKTALIIDGAGVFVKHNSASGIETNIIASKMFMDNGQLILEGNAQDLGSPEKINYRCVFNKKA
jgi:hypothetical protein